MIFKSHVFDEPLLEFGDGSQHCDPRQGLRPPRCRGGRSTRLRRLADMTRRSAMLSS
jgi:hypothetical protein